MDTHIGIDWFDLVLQQKKCSPKLYKNMKDDKSTVQTDLAQKICEKVGISRDQSTSLTDIPKFENVLDCDIIVISAEMGNKFIRTTNEKRTKLFVYLTADKHFHAVVNVSGFFNKGYFCHHCQAPFSNSNKHQCDNFCIVCKRPNCKETDVQFCLECGMTCRSKKCMSAHKQKNAHGNASECETWKRCPKCLKVLKVSERSLKDHVCDEYKCEYCKEYVPEEHRCHHNNKTKDVNNISKFVFLDFECTQMTMASCKEGYAPTPC